jgi:taurine dioxygenase
VIGDVPVGPGGRESELVAGKPFTDKHVVVVDD